MSAPARKSPPMDAGGKENDMSMIGSMYSGISGLIANGLAMEIIGNNLANINTPAFKASRPDFADILSRSMATGGNVGRGSQVQSVSQVFTQGGLQSTDNVTDMAIEGYGFFVLRNANQQGQYYTRAGNFSLDPAGYMVNPAGYFLQGYLMDSAGKTIGNPTDIRIGNAPLPPMATGSNTGVLINTNLDSNSTLNPGGAAFDVTDAAGTSSFQTSITIYDSLGNDHQVNVYFRKTAETATGNSWEYNVVVNGEDHASGADTVCATGTIEFNADGGLASETSTLSSFDLSGGASARQSMAFDFGEKRIGVAVGNTVTAQAQPLTTLHVESNQDRLAAVGKLVAEWQPSRFVIGEATYGNETADAPMTSSSNWNQTTS